MPERTLQISKMHRLDHITDMTISKLPAFPIQSVPGFENGIDYRRFSTAMPYMFSDKPERVTFLADTAYIDQIVDWFGSGLKGEPFGEHTVRISVCVSPNAMLYWSLQYASAVEVLSPPQLREQIRQVLHQAAEKYETGANQT